jgi:hypothetical protein
VGNRWRGWARARLNSRCRSAREISRYRRVISGLRCPSSFINGWQTDSRTGHLCAKGMTTMPHAALAPYIRYRNAPRWRQLARSHEIARTHHPNNDYALRGYHPDGSATRVSVGALPPATSGTATACASPSHSASCQLGRPSRFLARLSTRTGDVAPRYERRRHAAPAYPS